MQWLALLAIMVCAFSRYSYLLDPPWCFFVLAIYILCGILDEREQPERR